MKALTVFKIGGKVIDDELQLKQVLKALSKRDEPFVLIHGGGSIASEMEKKLGLTPTMIQGRRVTSQDSLNIVTMVYAGLVNKTIVAGLQANGMNAIGLSGADGNAITAIKRDINPVDFGFVGDIVSINTNFLTNLIDQGLTPVFSAITHDKQGQLLNTNADTLASEVAQALSKNYKVELIMIFEKEGVLDANGKLMTEINKESFDALVKDKIIKDGMIPKLTNAFSALSAGVQSVKLTSADYLHKTDSAYTTVTN